MSSNAKVAIEAQLTSPNPLDVVPDEMPFDVHRAHRTAFRLGRHLEDSA